MYEPDLALAAIKYASSSLIMGRPALARSFARQALEYRPGFSKAEEILEALEGPGPPP